MNLSCIPHIHNNIHDIHQSGHIIQSPCDTLTKIEGHMWIDNIYYVSITNQQENF